MTISTSPGVRRLYDWLGSRYDWFEFYEGRAKVKALEWLALESGLDVLNVGSGTGKEHALIAKAVAPGGMAVALDVSSVLLHLVSCRTSTPCVFADASCLPFAPGSFDRIYMAYVLDLLPQAVQPEIVSHFFKLLRPGGKLVLVCLTEGITLPSRGLVTAWKIAYKVSPVLCGGCRPIRVAGIVAQGGFTDIQREVVVQMAVPSEIIVATKPLASLSPHIEKRKENSMSLKDQIRTELEETRQAFLRLFSEVTDAYWYLPSKNPAWTIGEMMYHITVAAQNIPADVVVIRKTPWLPNLPIGLLHLLNPPLTRWGAGKYPRALLLEKFKRDHANLLALLETVQEDEWGKGRTYLAYDPPLLEGFVTIGDLFHYQKYHFEQHASDIRYTLNALRVASEENTQRGAKTGETSEGSALIQDPAPEREMLPYPGKGWQRTLFRAPIPLWRLGVGPILGKIMMLITHTGRKSGRIRRTMVEYHAWDGVKYVAAAWGEKADWYRNIQTHPFVTIQTADGVEHVKAERVSDNREMLSVHTLFMRRDPPLTKWYLESKGVNPADPADILAKKNRLFFVRFSKVEFPATEPFLPPVKADLKWVMPVLGAVLFTSWYFLKNRGKRLS